MEYRDVVYTFAAGRIRREIAFVFTRRRFVPYGVTVRKISDGREICSERPNVSVADGSGCVEATFSTCDGTGRSFRRADDTPYNARVNALFENGRCLLCRGPIRCFSDEISHFGLGRAWSTDNEREQNRNCSVTRAPVFANTGGILRTLRSSRNRHRFCSPLRYYRTPYLYLIYRTPARTVTNETKRAARPARPFCGDVRSGFLVGVR